MFSLFKKSAPYVVIIAQLGTAFTPSAFGMSTKDLLKYLLWVKREVPNLFSGATTYGTDLVGVVQEREQFIKHMDAHGGVSKPATGVEISSGEGKGKLVLREMHPDYSIFRGVCGADCSTAKEAMQFFTPGGRTLFVYREERLLGYVSLREVINEAGEKGLYIASLGVNHIGKDATRLIAMLGHAAPALGGKFVLSPNAVAIPGLSNQPEIKAVLMDLAATSTEPIEFHPRNAAVGTATFEGAFHNQGGFFTPELNRAGARITLPKPEALTTRSIPLEGFDDWLVKHSSDVLSPKELALTRKQTVELALFLHETSRPQAEIHELLGAAGIAPEAWERFIALHDRAEFRDGSGALQKAKFGELHKRMLDALKAMVSGGPEAGGAQEASSLLSNPKLTDAAYLLTSDALEEPNRAQTLKIAGKLLDKGKSAQVADLVGTHPEILSLSKDGSSNPVRDFFSRNVRHENPFGLEYFQLHTLTGTGVAGQLPFEERIRGEANPEKLNHIVEIVFLIQGDHPFDGSGVRILKALNEKNSLLNEQNLSNLKRAQADTRTNPAPKALPADAPGHRFLRGPRGHIDVNAARKAVHEELLRRR